MFVGGAATASRREGVLVGGAGGETPGGAGGTAKAAGHAPPPPGGSPIWAPVVAFSAVDRDELGVGPSLTQRPECRPTGSFHKCFRRSAPGDRALFQRSHLVGFAQKVLGTNHHAIIT